MVVKFFRTRSERDEPGGLDYILADPTARLVHGDPIITRAAIEASPTNVRQRFTAGVLSFERLVDESIVADVASSFGEQLLGGRSPASLAWCAVEHSGKGRSEIHFVAPLLDLLFGKIVNPYIDRIDRLRMRYWCERTNLQHGLKDPLDQLRVEPSWRHMQLPLDHIRKLKRIFGVVQTAVEARRITDRQTLVSFLEDMDYQVRAHTAGGSFLEQPVVTLPGGVNLRLSGSAYYRPDFGVPALPRETAAQHRLEELDRLVHECLEFRARWTTVRLFGAAGLRDGGDGNASAHLLKLSRNQLRAFRQDRPPFKLYTKSEIQAIHLHRMLGDFERPLPRGASLATAKKAETKDAEQPAQHPLTSPARVPDERQIQSAAKSKKKSPKRSEQPRPGPGFDDI